LVLWLIIICALIQCSPKSDIPIKYPEDTPMTKFIVGTWKIISAIDGESGNMIESNFPGFRIEDEATVSYGDHIGAIYKFIEPNVITVDNKRVLGFETWRLERKGDNLIIYATVDNRTTKYLLERCSDPLWC
jgi:hypothetical protein